MNVGTQSRRRGAARQLRDRVRGPGWKPPPSPPLPAAPAPAPPGRGRRSPLRAPPFLRGWLPSRPCARFSHPDLSAGRPSPAGNRLHRRRVSGTAHALAAPPSPHTRAHPPHVQSGAPARGVTQLPTHAPSSARGQSPSGASERHRPGVIACFDVSLRTLLRTTKRPLPERAVSPDSPSNWPPAKGFLVLVLG